MNSENSSKVAAAQRVDQLSGPECPSLWSAFPGPNIWPPWSGGTFFDLYLAEVRLTADFESLTQLVGNEGRPDSGGWSDPATDGLLSAFRAAGAGAALLCRRLTVLHLIQNAPIVPICFKNGSS